MAESRVSSLEGTAEEDGEDVCLLEEENERLRDRLGDVTDEADELRWQLEEKMEEFAAALEDRKEELEEDDTAAAPTEEKDTTASNACNNLELERTKIKLSEVERSNRQLSRKLTAVQGVADSAVRHKEREESWAVESRSISILHQRGYDWYREFGNNGVDATAGTGDDSGSCSSISLHSLVITMRANIISKFNCTTLYTNCYLTNTIQSSSSNILAISFANVCVANARHLPIPS